VLVWARSRPQKQNGACVGSPGGGLAWPPNWLPQQKRGGGGGGVLGAPAGAHVGAHVAAEMERGQVLGLPAGRVGTPGRCLLGSHLLTWLVAGVETSKGIMCWESRPVLISCVGN
jgi:hypothetical protein